MLSTFSISQRMKISDKSSRLTILKQAFKEYNPDNYLRIINNTNWKFDEVRRGSKHKVYLNSLIV